jgi:mannose-6-phosphate isomerase-like protein (cupin superfamily)
MSIQKTFPENLFLEYDQVEPIIVSNNVTRKFAYLNDLMTVIVDFSNGPMEKPDPFHSHPAEQTTYVANGEVLVIIGEQQKKLKAGDIFIVPSNVPHTVQSLTQELRLIDNFNPIRKEFIE